MKIDAQISRALASVRAGALRRHALISLERSHIHMVVTADGAPRLWGYALDAVLQGFRESIKQTENEPSNERLQLGLKAARASLVNACNALVERNVPDAHVCAILYDQGRLSLAQAGNTRVYLHRGGRPERLTPRQRVPGGLLQAPVSVSDHGILAGDLLLLGSESAFSTSAIARVASILLQDPKSSPAILASLLTEPARKLGDGAAAAALRFP